MNWDYKTIPLTMSASHCGYIESVLRDHGGNGWELVSVTAVPPTKDNTCWGIAIFKKPLQTWERP